jgi:hypothetical protein
MDICVPLTGLWAAKDKVSAARPQRSSAKWAKYILTRSEHGRTHNGIPEGIDRPDNLRDDGLAVAAARRSRQMGLSAQATSTAPESRRAYAAEMRVPANPKYRTTDWKKYNAARCWSGWTGTGAGTSAASSMRDRCRKYSEAVIQSR